MKNHILASYQDLRVCWAPTFRKAVSKPELLSSRTVMHCSLHSQWEMLLPQHIQSQSVLHIW